MIKFNATIEFLSSQLAIVELHDLSGQWAGSYRVDSGNLYENGYARASQEAALKGGRVETYKVTPKPVDFTETQATCQSRVEIAPLRRPANALNIEIGTPMARCMNKRPSHWTEKMTAIRWLASGGEALVLGVCSRNCPRFT